MPVAVRARRECEAHTPILPLQRQAAPAAPGQALPARLRQALILGRRSASSSTITSLTLGEREAEAVEKGRMAAQAVTAVRAAVGPTVELPA